MNAALLYRFAWKEGRLLWPLNLALLVVGTFLFRMLAMFGGLEQQSFGLQLWGLAWASSLVLLALVNGALTFAPENDQQTLRFLRTLPLPPGQLALAKLAGTALPVFLAFVGSLLCGGSVLQLGLGRLFRDSYPGQLVDDSIFFVPHLLLLGLAAFALGACCSLLLRQSVLALCAGLLALLAVNGLFGNTWSQNSSPAFFWGRLAGLLLLSLGSLAAIVSWLSPAWVRDQPLRVFPFSAARPLTATERWLPSAFGRQFGRLLWQSLRLNAPILLAGLALPVVSVLGGIVLGRLVEPFIAWLPPALFAALASTAFWNDQRLGRYRFFHQHPTSARTLWATRVLPWLAVAMVVGVVFRLTIQTIVASEMLQRTDSIYLNDFSSREGNWLLGLFLQSPSAGLLMFGLAAAVGAYCSLAFRSGIVACFAAVVGQAGMVLVANYLTWLGGNLIWCLAPVAFGLLWAGWWFAPRWLNQRVTWTSQLGVAAGLMVAGICSLGLLAGWRTSEIDSLFVPPTTMVLNDNSSPRPSSQPSTVTNFTPTPIVDSIRYRAEQIETARELVEFLAPFREQSREWSAEALWERFFGYDFDPLSLESPDNKLRNWVARDLNERIAKGELEAAQENLRLLLWLDAIYTAFPNSNHLDMQTSKSINAWAVAAGQTPQLLQSFLEELRSFDSKPVDLRAVYAERIASRLSRSWSLSSPAESRISAASSRREWGYWLSLALPWERTRSAQLLRRQAEFLRRAFVQRYLGAAQKPRSLQKISWWGFDYFLSKTTEMGDTTAVKFTLGEECAELLSGLHIRHWLMLRLALLTHYLEHGGYPTSLLELNACFASYSPGFLQDLSGRVVYLPHGSEYYLVWNSWRSAPGADIPGIAPQTPVILPLSTLDLRPTGIFTATNTPNQPTTGVATGAYQKINVAWNGLDIALEEENTLPDLSKANAIVLPQRVSYSPTNSQFARRVLLNFESQSQKLIELVWLPTDSKAKAEKSSEK
ncbi:MAG: hypothetical protein ACK6CE_16300 [Planctomycetota bacterium]